MGNPIEDTMRNFAVNKLNEEAGFGEDPPFFGVQLFGWDIYRIFRDENKEMIKIILVRDGIFHEFENTNWRKEHESNN